MQYGICNLNIVPVRLEAADASEMVTQLLYGDHFKVLEKRKNWSKIRIAFDAYEGWIDNKQYLDIEENTYQQLQEQPGNYVSDLVEFAISNTNSLLPVCLGANIAAAKLLENNYDGRSLTGVKNRTSILETAMLYMNAPYLWGGKSPFGIDCSGLTQMVYKLNGYSLFRDASQQAKQGEALSFIEESAAGDLAFFDNNEGEIIHVGIIMPDNYIVHAHGKVRIDRLDHSGIFNSDTKRYTHNLRVIKKIID
ncbi:C40 family peptidase [Haloflavibacter putidus]|uniref:NlpC/P60 family protein n=1 Tax=Haloflavibacter putidus TaxID=2576776 RepID=A0A507ZVK5_9FLAO|nr:C40 family peptidase [Haloflavibacter putidus]TQD40274.1 NlpC/P60 family protein [Haloflavibacter putidus]